MPEQAISAFDALADAVGAELLADRSGTTGKLTPAQIVAAAEPSDLGAEEELTYPAPTAATSITLDADDNRTVIRTTADTTVTVTAPSLAQGTAVLIIQEGAGQVQLTASGVTFHHPDAFVPNANERYSELLLHWKTATLVQVSGDLALAP